MNAWDYRDIFKEIVQKEYPLMRIASASNNDLNSLIFLVQDPVLNYTHTIKRVEFTEKEIILKLRKHKLNKIL